MSYEGEDGVQGVTGINDSGIAGDYCRTAVDTPVLSLLEYESPIEAKIFQLLRKEAEADLAKAELSLELLGKHGVGVGEHSTNDFYENAREALNMMVDATDRLEMLDKLNE